MLNRYDRQERVAAIGAAGQAKISAATILIAGVGALGSYAAEQLVRSGVGHLILVDPDTVSLTNLQRQTLFTEADVQQRALKVDAAKRHLLAINHQVEITTMPTSLSGDLLQETTFDLVLDCLDNYGARILLNRAALVRNFDYIFASCAGTFGSVMPIQARQHACLNCVYPNLAELQQTDCDLLGVNTALVPIIAGLQVSLALHYLVDASTVNFDQLTTVDNWQLSQQAFRVRKNPACPTCQRTDWDLTEPAIPNQVQVLCGTETYQGRLNSRPQLAAISDWLVDRQLTVNAHASFVSFTAEDKTVSIFKNGKVLLYGLPDITAATQLFNRLQTQLNPFLEVSVS
ncbi:ThiF family adenylyltransferase [Lactiplantibacillus pentosus]|uniref:HesA/MoeB/ThiF family protein n=1 Tax=Lactiplantibacillus pentosus TaxID=1589 RepID=A0AAW8W0K3_LACPE|nr:HesA/MoeB/ThiF family protein [Lactiplantibacillus pentosus]MBO9164125.1 HesA/MoeB/ThiF family protein [Lactiplantibacillus pentosus]MBU7465367.1 HesA/MoeB/ThiF family protein [Lactiplantibacillus pentosus]MBU7472968.1 HesA/MoeB/ThiF family protein [Lactiplantibacillus pentosus]MBU7491321.1 HesA/MoeB/ThiF family protein [Lactiplantibacillus pentosus]MBU7494242.1 HesA/MoeB/ThiF family protein [Lactiplantibacillus pentosus]